MSDTTLKASAQGMERLDAFARRFPDARTGVTPDAAALARFQELMDDDLGTVQATGELFDVLRRANSLADQGQADAAAPLAAAVYEMCRAVGLVLATAVHLGGDVPIGFSGSGTLHAGKGDAVARTLAAARDEARGRGDYAAADALRQRLQSEGWIVEDTPGGTVIRR